MIKAAKDKNLLSFDQEDDEFESPAPPRSKGFTSVHEALAGKDQTLSKESVISTAALAEQKLRKQVVEQAKSDLLAKVASAVAEGDRLDQATKELQSQSLFGKRRAPVNVDKEIEKLEQKEKRRKTDFDTEGLEEGDGTVRAVKRAAQKRFRVATTKLSRASDSEEEDDEDISAPVVPQLTQA